MCACYWISLRREYLEKNEKVKGIAGSVHGQIRFQDFWAHATV